MMNYFKYLIKPEYPWIFGFMSMAMSGFVLLCFVVFHSLFLIGKSPENIFSIGLSAFGVTAALSAICYTIPLGTLKSSSYAAEKFLHSSVILIQCIIVFFIGDSLASTETTAWHGLNLALNWIGEFFKRFSFILSTLSSFCWLWGFSSINKDLWKSWEQRVEAKKG